MQITLDLNEANDRSLAHSWTMVRIRKQIGSPADEPEIAQGVERALCIMANMPPDCRTMTTFSMLIPNEEAAQAMRLYSQQMGEVQKKVLRFRAVKPEDFKNG